MSLRVTAGRVALSVRYEGRIETKRAKQSRLYEEIAHLHCTTPALAGGARERSAA